MIHKSGVGQGPSLDGQGKGPAPQTSLARRIVGTALDAVFPPRCVGCGEFGALICDRCLGSATRATGDRCTRCWLPLSAGRCRNCAGGLPAFAGLRSAFRYEGIARDAVLALKFDGVSALAPQMASEMTAVLRRWAPPVDAIVPVPLGVFRRRTRGYNQSELLAREISRRSELPLANRALHRSRNTHPQAQQPDAESRRQNMSGAFKPGRPINDNVLLVDDVSTTGATLDACARTLLANGATNVYALTFAIED